MINVLKKLGAITLLSISIFSFISCNSSTKRVENADTLSKTENNIKLDKENALSIDYSDNSYSKI